LLRANGASILPVVDEGFPVGVVTEASLLDAQTAGYDLEADVAVALGEVLTLSAATTGADALRQLADNPGNEGALVVDGQGRLMGLLFPSDLFPKPALRLRPPMIGGMATPFGVFLSAGSVTAGPPWWALASSGALLVTLITIARIIVVLSLPLLASFHFSKDVLASIQDFGSLALFGVLLHAVPLAGIHAAEHMVVHAVEREEPLTPEVVARMPRVHPRCGTNLAVGVFLLTLATVDWGLPADLVQFQLLGGIAITLLFWRRVGGLAQLWITTRRPNREQIEMGIKSANELLDRYAQAPVERPTFLQRLWNSGIVYTALGGMLTGWTYALLFWFTNHRDWIGF
jgi:hypothetical protein